MSNYAEMTAGCQVVVNHLQRSDAIAMAQIIVPTGDTRYAIAQAIQYMREGWESPIIQASEKYNDADMSMHLVQEFLKGQHPIFDSAAQALDEAWMALERVVGAEESSHPKIDETALSIQKANEKYGLVQSYLVLAQNNLEMTRSGPVQVVVERLERIDNDLAMVIENGQTACAHINVAIESIRAYMGSL